VLNDQDLIRLLGLDSMDHHIEVARRPKLGSAVVEVILEQDEAQVMTALAANDTADISASGMSRLVAASERIASLRSPLARHPRLAPDLAERMYAWVGQSLRTAVGARFRLDTAALDAALNAAVKDARDGGGARINAVLDGVMSEEMETGLVEKLHAAGQLQPGLLLRVLREGRLRLFIAALAKLGRFERSDIRRSIDSDRPEILALACAAVGIDRSVFPAILEMIRKLNGGKPGGGVEGARRAAGAFGPFAPDIAASAFRQTAAKV
jgi:uncharacterized protein (DUF2336 family)